MIFEHLSLVIGDVGQPLVGHRVTGGAFGQSPLVYAFSFKVTRKRALLKRRRALLNTKRVLLNRRRALLNRTHSVKILWIDQAHLVKWSLSKVQVKQTKELQLLV